LTGKVVLVTGGNSGIGKATALELARQGASLILACRNRGTARLVEEEIRSSGNDSVRSVELDLSDVRSVERCARVVTTSTDRLDVLINNSGAAFRSRTLTPQGFEQTFAVNYLGHYTLTRLLLPHLLLEPHPRVVSVCSSGHKLTRGIRWDDPTFAGRFSTMAAYAKAKLAEVLFTRELAKRYGGAGLVAQAVHPGFVGSSFYEHAGSGPT
jgi:NAD(P)-dependent dehydrogenase (short-subunit alcohol dehydrogenase family)